MKLSEHEIRDINKLLEEGKPLQRYLNRLVLVLGNFGFLDSFLADCAVQAFFKRMLVFGAGVGPTMS
jgi:hypothetical protein